jgi:hypothetical protein
MKLSFLRYQTRTLLKSNHAVRASLPYKQAHSIGILFTVEDRKKHDEVKELVKRLELEGKKITVLCFLPKNKDNYEFMFDFFTDKDLSFWGSITSPQALKFADTPFDFLFYLDNAPNPLVLNILARSKAKCRVGKFFDKGEPYFEFMLEIKNGIRSLIDGIHNYASKLR